LSVALIGCVRTKLTSVVLVSFHRRSFGVWVTALRRFAAGAAALLLGANLLNAQAAESERARELLVTGHTAEAAAIYRELARAHPDDVNALLNLSIAEYKGADFRGAAASAAAALKLKPDFTPASLFLGASYLKLGEFGKAVDALARLVAKDPRERNGRLMLGEALVGAGRPSDAVNQLRVAAEMLPSNPRVWYELGRAYETLGLKQPASEAWERLMTLPPSLESHQHAAEVNDAGHRWREGAREWMEALKFAPEDRSVRVGLAWSLFRSRDYEAAMVNLKPLLGVGASAETQFLYGASLLNLQKPEEAMSYLRAALVIDLRLLPAKAALGQALLQTGKAEEAIPLLKSALSVDQDGSVHFQLFRAYQLTKRNAEAQRTLAAYRRLRESLVTAP
jgi:predicted Zn-dependent protease